MLGTDVARRRAAPAALASLLGLLLGGCQTMGPAASTPAVTVEAPASATWETILSAEDRDRLARLDAAWEQGLAAARRGGFTRRLTAEGDLLEPQTALERAALPPGSYRCRLITLGASGRRARSYAATGPFFCYVGAEGGNLSFTKQTGPVRPGGYLYDDGDARQIFIGASARASERVPPAYGDRPESDVVGIVQRVGPFKYRLVVPWPRSGAAVEVYELVPALA
jgi:hypothetical protein